MTIQDLEDHIRKNLETYSAMVVVAALFCKLYGHIPRIGLSGEQASYVKELLEKLPN